VRWKSGVHLSQHQQGEGEGRTTSWTVTASLEMVVAEARVALAGGRNLYTPGPVGRVLASMGGRDGRGGKLT